MSDKLTIVTETVISICGFDFRVCILSDGHTCVDDEDLWNFLDTNPSPKSMKALSDALQPRH